MLMRLGWNRNSLPAGMKVTVVGFQAKDGSLRASSRDLKFPDGRKMDLGRWDPLLRSSRRRVIHVDRDRSARRRSSRAGGQENPAAVGSDVEITNLKAGLKLG